MTEMFVKITEPLHKRALYIYDTDDCPQFRLFIPQPESWSAWLGRRTADGASVITLYWVLKWCGIIVNVTVQS